MSALTSQFEKRSKTFVAAVSLSLVAAIGLVDFLTGYAIFFSAFYLIPVALAAWFCRGAVGVVISILCVAVSLAGDYAAGAHYPNSFVPIWNGVIAMAVYLVVVKTITSLRRLHQELETRVRERTAALAEEAQERARLEKEILEISEREQRRIGHDLHDGLCQHLAALTLAGQVLSEKLAAKAAPEAADARKIVHLLEDSIALTRSLARGIAPVDMEADGLALALRELAANISQLSNIGCRLECDPPPLIHDADAATQLYRIAQEAINNALRHGKPGQIVVSLSRRKARLELTVEDDGAGLPEVWQKHRGLGTRIMAHRATMMGGTFSIEPNPTGGTFVKCSIPAANANPP